MVGESSSEKTGPVADSSSAVVGTKKGNEQGPAVVTGGAEGTNQLLVRGLSDITSARELRSFFKQFGKIGRIKIMTTLKEANETELNERFAHVAVPTPSLDRIDKLVEAANGMELKGSCLIVTRVPEDGPHSRKHVMSNLTAKPPNNEESADSGDGPLESAAVSTIDKDKVSSEENAKNKTDNVNVHLDSTDNTDVELDFGPENEVKLDSDSNNEQSSSDADKPKSAPAASNVVDGNTSTSRQEPRKKVDDQKSKRTEASKDEVKNKPEKKLTTGNKNNESLHKNYERPHKKRRNESPEHHRNRPRSPKLRSNDRCVSFKDARPAARSNYDDGSSSEASWDWKQSRHDSPHTYIRGRRHDVVQIPRNGIPEYDCRRPRAPGKRRRSQSPQQNLLTLEEIKEARERRRGRASSQHPQRNYKDERYAAAAEKHKRRNNEMDRELKELQWERERLRSEREEIERERIELMWFERERQRLKMEREKIAKEKDELQKTRLRMKEQRQADRELCHSERGSVSFSRNLTTNMSSSRKTMAELAVEREREESMRERRGESGSRSRSKSTARAPPEKYSKGVKSRNSDDDWETTTTTTKPATEEPPLPAGRKDENTRANDSVKPKWKEYLKPTEYNLRGGGSPSSPVFVVQQQNRYSKQFGHGTSPRTYVSSFLPKKSSDGEELGMWNKQRLQGKPEQWMRGSSDGGGYPNPPASMIPLPPQVNLHTQYAGIPAFRAHASVSGPFFGNSTPVSNFYGRDCNGGALSSPFGQPRNNGFHRS